MQPQSSEVGELFFTRMIVQSMEKTEEIRQAELTGVLVDAGAQGNLVPAKVVQTLQCKRVPVKLNYKLADGQTSAFKALTWLMVSVAGTTRVICAMEVRGDDPGYTLLLGRHWMATVATLGNYKANTYTVEGNDKSRVQSLVSLRKVTRPRTGYVEVYHISVLTRLSR